MTAFSIVKNYVFCGVYINENEQSILREKEYTLEGRTWKPCFQNMNNGKLRDYSIIVVG